jgi:hypothetical protein
MPKHSFAARGVASTEVLEYANTFVLPLLRRRERMEDIGEVLELLQRYRFLFTLPHMITQNIEKVCGKGGGGHAGIQ